MDPTVSPLQAYAPVLPEIVMVVGALALLMVGVFRGERSAESVSWLSVALLVLATLLIFRESGDPKLAFNGTFIVDDFARFMKALTLLGSAVVIVMSFDFLRDRNLMRYEFPVLILLATTGMMVMISANDLITLYLGLELQSLSLYVIAAFRRDSVRSSEAGLKYFVLGALSSGMLPMAARSCSMAARSFTASRARPSSRRSRLLCSAARHRPARPQPRPLRMAMGR